MNWDAIRKSLSEKSSGREYWRSLEELAGSQEFQRYLHNEFPHELPVGADGVSRRRVMQLVGASLGLAGLTACTRQPEEKIVPYVRQPEGFVPGKPLFYATAMPVGGFARGLLVESHLGRPTKVEGNPDHPDSLGATDIFAQAAVLGLYDPDRSRTVKRAGRISSWVAFANVIGKQREQQLVKKGGGLRILTETITSPSLAAQLRDLLKELPEARWHQYEPVNRDMARAGAMMAFGEYAATRYDFSKADVVVSLDADFLSPGPGSLPYARAFAARRNPSAGMNRLYAVEGTPSLVGAMADHRLVVKTSEVENFARALAAKLGVAGANPAAAEYKWLEAIAKDLGAHRGRSIVIAGDQQPAAVHALAHAINNVLGNAGSTVLYTSPVEAEPADQAQSIGELVREMNAGRVEFLAILGGNPVFDAPADLDFAGALKKVPLRAHLGLYHDETAELCHWHVPQAHFLETWSDARAFDGTVSVMQPLIAPLYDGRSLHEFVSALAGKPQRTGHEIVREYWQVQKKGGDFNPWWLKTLHDGVMAGTAYAPKQVALKPLALAPFKAAEGVEAVFRPDPTIWDGRFANNGWLQEIPKPLTKLTWDNTVQVSPATAERLGLENEDVVEVTAGGRRVKAPVWITPGHADDSVTVFFGYGRRRGGKIATGAGTDAYPLRTSQAPWCAGGAALRKTGEKQRLACTQHHHSMEGRSLARAGTLEEFKKHPEFAQHMGHNPPKELTILPEWKYEGHSWGMAIDLNACTGCNACVIACQAENNIPVVGKEQIARGREMHWMRVDRYYGGELDNPETLFQPVNCMQCENAPCEIVCPVAATTHSEDGLNQMTYNRCVGTRYCANNCPYKVRRFNYLLYADWTTEELKPLRNPEVSVRSRGVMEKCTYCVQRIEAAKIESAKEGRRIRDGEVVAACQQVCPTQAIHFGDLNDKSSGVAKIKADPRNYALLGELNTRPRTTHLARLRNPNPEIEPKAAKGGTHHGA